MISSTVWKLLASSTAATPINPVTSIEARSRVRSPASLSTVRASRSFTTLPEAAIMQLSAVDMIAEK